MDLAVKKGVKLRISLGIILMLLSIMAATALACGYYVGYIKENIYLLGALLIGILLAAFRLKFVSTLVLIYLFLSYSAWKIYSFYAEGLIITINAYAWIVIFAAALIGAMLFTFGFKALIVSPPETEPYNTDALYMSARTHLFYVKHYGSKLSMLVVKLRYPKEMKAVLKKSQYEEVIIRLEDLLTDIVKSEDRVFPTSEDGEFVLLLSCDYAKAKEIRNRILERMEDYKWLEGVADRPIRGEVKIGYVEYTAEKFHGNIERFLERAIEEADYDI